ncbi:MAG TPA: hypothetical protein VMN81_09485 [Vicinamibacterales bacterium]|nr:hypothetical protein [Vicinamibacterales bacterium]
MTVRPNVDAGRLVNVALFLCIALLVVSLLGAGSIFAVFVFAAAGGALIGFAVAQLRSPRGLGATEFGERAPEHAGNVGMINMAHIPVMGIGGLGIVAMSFVVAMFLPQGRNLMAWSLTGAAIGAGGCLMWRHFHGGSPFEANPRETLHLR